MNQSSFLVAVIIAGCLYVFGQYVSSEPARNSERSLTVQGTGVVNSAPDIAHVTLGVQVQPKATAEEATAMLATQANAVIAAVKALGIEEKDLKTQNVSVQPTYNYEEGKQTLRGYEASEQIEVTVRKADQVGDIISRATGAGANQIGGVTFENEDSQPQQLAAEKEAIAAARKKAEELASSLNVRLGKVKQYNVQQNYPGGPVPYASELKTMGRGGDSAVSPEVPVGTQENSVTVTVTYGIR
jgi:uncharacterized protein